MRNSKPTWGPAAAVLALASLSLSPVDAQDNAEARLRAQLRQATVQLRDMQDQNAALMLKQSEAERERNALAEKLAADEKELASLRQRFRSSQTASAQATATLTAQRENFAKVDAKNRETFSKLQAAYNESVQTGRMHDEDLMRFEAEAIQLRSRVQACETKNTELVRLGKEVLDLYDKRGLLSSLASLEPVTKLKRVQYENMMQDYEDKMRANEIVRPRR